jgi:hypothetical protein
MPQETNKVRLIDFAAFASRMGWDLAERFPWKELSYVDERGNEVTLVNVDGKQMVRTPAGGYITQERWKEMSTPRREPVSPEVATMTKPLNHGAPVPSDRLIPNETRKKPEWDLWGSVPTAYLWAAVALSCDIHPNTVDLMDLSASDLAQFTKRFTIALVNARSGTLKVVEHETPTARVPDYAIEVNLLKFASWAQALRYPWELPEEFPFAPKAEHPPLVEAEPATNQAHTTQSESTPPGKSKAQSERMDSQVENESELRESARTTLLMIIAGAIGDGIENHSTAAKTIERRLEKWGIESPKHRQILNWLIEAKRVLDERKAKS